MELSETTEVSDSSVDSLVQTMLQRSSDGSQRSGDGAQRSSDGSTGRMTFEQFRQVFCDEEFRHTLEKAKLSGEGEIRGVSFGPNVDQIVTK